MNKLLFFASLFLCSQGICQSVPQTVQSTYDNHFEQSPREKLFLHISKPQYLAGETIWFRIFHYSEHDHQSFAFSKVVYVELIDEKNEAVLQQKVRIDASGGEGWMDLPTSMNSGNYRIRTYTLWMRNFDSGFYYSQPVEVINTFKRLNLREQEEAETTIAFYPEGGHLVRGITSRIGIRVGEEASPGFLLIGKDTIQIEVNALGMGSFDYKPTETTVSGYWQDIDGRKQAVRLPEAKPEGYVMRVTREGDGYVCEINAKSGAGKVYLAGISRDEFLFIDEHHLEEGQVVFSLPDNKLKEGVNQLTLFNSEGIPVNERLVFKYPQNKMEVSVASKGTQKKQRMLVELEIDTEDMNGPTASDLSISVYRSELAGGRRTEMMEAAMWLTNELNDVPDPNYFFTNPEAKVREDLELLLLIQGWRVYDYNLLDEPNVFPPEFVDQLFIANMIEEDTQRPITNELVSFSFPNAFTQLFLTKSDSLGNIVMETKDVFGSSDIMLATPSMDSVLVAINIKSPFDESADYMWSRFEVDTARGSYLLEESTVMQIENVFTDQRAVTLESDSNSFYMEPTNRYFLDDYTRFPVMEEVLREYVYGVFVRKERGKFTIKVIDEPKNDLMKNEPLVLLDGVPVFDFDKIMAIDPINIKQIDVVKNKYFYGFVTLDGVVAFYSYDSNLPDVDLKQQTIRTNYQGLQKHKVFYSPTYDKVSGSKKPDFRNQLYWNSSVRTDSKGKGNVSFYTSDATGSYTLQINGLSENGQPGSFSRVFQVNADQIKK